MLHTNPKKYSAISRARQLLLIALLSLGGQLVARQAQAQSGFSALRELDPVVVRGAALGNWQPGIKADSVVAFAFRNGAWVQIPLQVDEIVVADIAAPYGPAAAQYYTLPTGVNIEFYADANTYVGADTDPTLDANDELVFMAKDAGSAPAVWFEPNGIVSGSCLKLELVDASALDTAYVYLFRNDGSLQQSAGQSYVTYNFSLNAGSYPANYNIIQGPNPENTTVTTANYQHHFADRWISDQLKITVDTSTGVDILDRHQNFFGPGVCGRTENTFSNGEGCFATNKAGPIRVIRSYLGANSGPLTQRTHWFYATRHDISTDLRVHNIPSVYDVFDYSTAANGMVNTNNLNPNGTLIINGQPETGVNTSGRLTWEMVSGPQGSLVIAHSLGGNIITGLDANLSYYWEDQTVNPVSDCTGDGIPYGTSGMGLTFVSNRNICTDPVGGNCGTTNAGYRTVSAKRSLYFQGPAFSTADAQTLAAQPANPITVRVDVCVPSSAPVASYQAPASACLGVPVQFTDASQNNTPPTYAWSFPGGTPDTSNIANPLVVYNAPGSYTVSLTISGGASTSCNGCITIHPVPVAGFSATPNPVQAGDTVQLTSTSTGATQYQWNLDGTPLGFNAIASFVAPNTAGTVDVQLIVQGSGGCADTLSQQVVVEAPSALAPDNSLRGVVLYPQPAAHSLTIALPITTSPAQAVQAVVYDLQGRLLLSASLTQPQAQLSIDALPAGSYFIRLSAADGSTAVHPLVVVR